MPITISGNRFQLEVVKNQWILTENHLWFYHIYENYMKALLIKFSIFSLQNQFDNRIIHNSNTLNKIWHAK